MGSTSASSPQPVRVLVIGANGYLGSAISRAFLRAARLPSFYFQVYGLVRCASTARALALQEVIPIVGSLSDTGSVSQAILSHSRTLDVIVNCTEPSKSDPVAEAQHWYDVLVLVQGLAEASASAPRGKPVYSLVLWSSGCKDYGTTELHGDPRLKEHSEASPLNPHKVVRCRTEGALRALALAGKNKGRAAFDVVVVRATPVFGYSGSYYGPGSNMLLHLLPPLLVKRIAELRLKSSSSLPTQTRFCTGYMSMIARMGMSRLQGWLCSKSIT